MGLLNGSASLTRYKTLGLKKSYKLSDLNENLGKFQSKRLKLQGSHKDEAVGWVMPVGIDAGESETGGHWDLSHCRVDDGFVLRFRIEKRRVPGSLLQLIAKERIQKKEAGRSKPLGAKEKKQLLLDTKLELMEMTLPAINHEEAFWRPDSGRLSLFSQNKKTIELFEGLFHKTFCEHLHIRIVKVDTPLQGLADTDWETSEALDKFVKQISGTVPTNLSGSVH